MGKFNLAQITKKVGNTLTKHSPEILTGVGIAGMFTTVVLAVKATPKALHLIEEKKKETGVEKLPPLEVVKTTWKCYIPAAVTAALSTTCLISSNSISARRNAVLATAYNIAETARREYKEKVIETIGEKKEQVINEKIAQDKIDKNPVKNSDVIITDVGSTLFYDTFSGRYFKSDMQRIRKAENDLNFTMRNDNYVSLNDFYEAIGVERTSLGDELGWNIDNGKVEIGKTARITEDGQACIVLQYNIAPKYDYWKMN